MTSNESTFEAKYSLVKRTGTKWGLKYDVLDVNAMFSRTMKVCRWEFSDSRCYLGDVGDLSGNRPRSAASTSKISWTPCLKNTRLYSIRPRRVIYVSEGNRATIARLLCVAKIVWAKPWSARSRTYLDTCQYANVVSGFKRTELFDDLSSSGLDDACLPSSLNGQSDAEAQE